MREGQKTHFCGYMSNVGMSLVALLRNLEATVLISIRCSDRGIYTVKSWELFKMPGSIIAVL